MKKITKGFLMLLATCILFLGCTQKENIQQNELEQQTASNNTPVTLTVSAAASLTDCLEEIKDIYINKNKNIDITYNFGASGALQQQIEQGAPADIFFSAGKKQMTALKDANIMVDSSIKDILENKLTVITSINSDDIKDMNDLTDSSIKKIAVGDPGSVPVGQYTDEALKNLNIFDKVESKLVFAKDVREVLSWVETENVDVGFVYQTDAQISDKVKISLIAPEGSHKPVVYPIGVVKASEHTKAAQDFVDFLFGDEAKELFIKYGFSPPILNIYSNTI